MSEGGRVTWWCACGELMVRDHEYGIASMGWRYRCPRAGCNVRLTLPRGRGNIVSDEHSLTFKVQLSEKRATAWVTDARIMAGDYYMHEFTDEPVIVAMTLDDAREFHGWLTTVIERNASPAAVGAEDARLRERVAALEAALERGRDFIARTIEAVTPEPCRCAPVEFCGECLAIKTLEEALTALAGEGQGA